MPPTPVPPTASTSSRIFPARKSGFAPMKWRQFARKTEFIAALSALRGPDPMSSAESGAHCGCRTAFFATDQPTFPLHHLIPQSQAAVVLLFYGMVDADVSGHGWLR